MRKRKFRADTGGLAPLRFKWKPKVIDIGLAPLRIKSVSNGIAIELLGSSFCLNRNTDH